MEKITTDALIAKYPKIFKPYDGNPGDVNWHGVPEGWLSTIDDLCGSIQHYIDYVTRYVPNPDYIEGSEYDRNDITTHKLISKHPNQVTCTQIKEKFGGLRFYENGADNVVDGMIKMADFICSNTCQECGSRNDLGQTKGWIATMCRNCIIGHGDRAMASWKSFKN